METKEGCGIDWGMGGGGGFGSGEALVGGKANLDGALSFSFFKSGPRALSSLLAHQACKLAG